MLILLLSGCDDFGKYRGEYPELMVVATNSLIFTNVYSGIYIEVLEEDGYGRKLFTFTGLDNNKAILICQKSDTSKSYYYEDKNYLQVNTFEIDNDVLADLKEKNDWNKPLKVNEMMKSVPILRKEENDIISDKKQEELFSTYLPKSYFHSGYSIYLTTDLYGGKIYCAKSIKEITDNEGNLYTPSVFMMFNPDESYNVETGIKEISDLNNYQEELIAFKELNSWNQPI